jgi:hypothetical protein
MTTATALIDLLEEEFCILRDGRYDDIAAIAARKDALTADKRNLQDVSPEALLNLAEAASRNAAMLEATMRGFEAARAEIEDIKNGLSHATYGKDGARAALWQQSGQLEKKL